MSTGVASACPQCGAPLRFGGAQSLATCCPACRAAVVRAGARLELAGKVPDLVAIDSRLSIGATGAVGGEQFTVLGRLQLSRGDATWNEWYASFARGVGWIAEAGGRLFLSRAIAAPAELPRLAALHAGRPVEIRGAGSFTVDEIDEARLASFEGELPFRPALGATYRYADATSGDGSFVTLDYGTGQEGDAPELFAGRELPWSALDLPGAAPVAGEEKARALTCPGCGGSVSISRPDARAATCPYCRSLLQVDPGGGPLRVLGILEQRSRPPVPLGARGTLRGEPLEVLGWMKRSTTVDGERYAWDELLLHGPAGYRWLSVYQGHWLLLRAVAAGKVAGRPGVSYSCDGRTFKHFQTAVATTDELQGEFTWDIRAGESVVAEDYVAPPYLLSVERSGKDEDGSPGEVAWTRGEHLDGKELWKAFGLPGSPPSAPGVGAAQPNPWRPRAASAWKASGLALLALLLLAAAFAIRARRELVAEVKVPLQAGQVTLSEPFELSGGPQAVSIEASAEVQQAWVGLDVALIEDQTGESETVGFELSRYSGVSDGESWSEGSNRGSAVAGAVHDGRYLLRIEPVLEHAPGGRVGPVAEVRVVEGVFLLTPLVLAMLAVALWPIACTISLASFEQRRWAESDHPPGGKSRAEEDE
jgi:hypothetical protein